MTSLNNIDNSNYSFPLSLWSIIKTSWKWWLSGAIFSFIMASILMTGWPAGLLPNIAYPFTYNGDGSFIAIQRLIEGWIFENSRTGYPFGSSLLDYPSSDSGNYLILKLIGSLTREWYATLNIYFLLGFAVTFVASFCVLLTVGIAIPFALTAAILFSFLAFHFQRIDHLFYTWYFVVPLFYYVALRLFNPNSLKEISASSSLQKVLFALGLITLGSFGVYYAAFGLIILTVIFISAALGKRNYIAIKFSFFAVFFVVIGVLLNLAPNLIHQYKDGKNPEVAQRGIGESEVYALKFTQLILPRSAHRNDAMGNINHKYSSETPLNNENSTATIGLIGALGIFAVLGIIFSNLIGKLHNSTLSVVSLLVLTLFMFGTIGGFGVIFAQFVTTSIRAWNRISVFISFGALLVFFMLLQLQIKKYFSGRRFFVFSSVISIVFIIAGLYDQTTATCTSCNAQINKVFHMDQKFVQSIEDSLPIHSAIYQLPYMAFPEPPPLYFRLQSYELAQGFLNSSSLRWSYGSMKGREGDIFYRSLSTESISKQLDVIKKLGFEGIYVDKRGFEDSGKAVIDAIINQLGTQPSLSRADGEIVFFRLPQAAPRVNLDGLSSDQIMHQAGYVIPPASVHQDKPSDVRKSLMKLVTLIWLGTILYLSRHLIRNRKIELVAKSPQKAILLSTLIFFIVLTLLALFFRNPSLPSTDQLRKTSTESIKASYHSSPSQDALVKDLDNFPTALPLATIQIALPNPTTLKAISISAIGSENTELGNWTTQPISHLWGIGILGETPNSKLVNYGKRKEDLNIPISETLSLLIPDNGNLSKCPDLHIQLLYINGDRASTVASCK